MEKNSKEFGEGILFVIANHIYWFILVSFYFFISNILLIVSLMLLQPTIENIIFYLLVVITSGPAISALCGCVIKLLEQKELDPTKDYFKYYKNNFKDTIKIWIPYCVLISIFLANINFFRHHDFAFGVVSIYLFIILIVVLTLTMITMIVINTKFNFRAIDIFKLGIYFTFSKIKISTGNFCILFLTFFLMYQFSDSMILIVNSLVLYFLVRNSYPIINEVTNRFVKKED